MLFITSCLVLDNKKSKVESASLTIVSRWFLLLDLNLSVALGTSESQFRYFQGVFQWKTKGTRASITRTLFLTLTFDRRTCTLCLSLIAICTIQAEKRSAVNRTFLRGKKRKKNRHQSMTKFIITLLYDWLKITARVLIVVIAVTGRES